VKFKQYYVTTALEISRIMEYRANFFFRLFINSLVPLAIKIFLFAAFFKAVAGDSVVGYTADSILIYQLWGALVILLVEIRSTIENVTFDIRMGRITRYLLYPISMFEIISCQYLAAFLIQIICFAFSLALLNHWVADFTIHLDNLAFWLALLFSFLGSLFWFLVHFTIGLAAFWLEEIWTFFIIFQMGARFLSGNPIPLDMFPESYHNISLCLPFHWMFFVPVKMFSEGKIPDNITFGLGVMLFWCLLTVSIHCYLWKKGLRQYSAAGM
jgi:ABC-2 type transport system permease protein